MVRKILQISKLMSGSTPDPPTSKQDGNANKVNGNVQGSEVIRLRREIGLLEAVSIIIGSIIGSGIFVSPKGVIELVHSVGLSLVIWAVCGVVSMIGALCYAELGTMMPGSGGDFHYLHTVFGGIPSFIFIWVQNLINGPANYAILSLTFSKYVTQPFFPQGCQLPESGQKLLAASAITLLTFINCLDVRKTTKLQNVIMFSKLTALTLVIIAGLYAVIFQGKTENFEKPFEGSVQDPGTLVVAFLSTVWAYGGWSTLNLVAEELKEPSKNLPKAIMISLPIVTFLYILANFAYFALLSPQDMFHSEAIAVTFEEKLTGQPVVMPIFVAISVFGTLCIAMMGNSRLLFAGSRVGHFPKVFGFLRAPGMTPTPSLIFLSTLSLIYLLSSSNIYTLITYSTYINSIGNVAVVSSLLYLRKTQPDHPRPIKVPLIIPIIFLVVSLSLCILPILHSPMAVGISIGIGCTALPVYFLFVQREPHKLIVKWMEIQTKWIQKLLLSAPEDAEIFLEIEKEKQ